MKNAVDFLDAIKAGEMEQVRIMLTTSPELRQIRDEAGVSAVMLATYYGQTDIAEELARLHVDLDIFEAAALGNHTRVSELLDQDPSLINAFSADFFTPLGFAAFYGNSRTVKLLIEWGADVNAASQNQMQVYPLHSAVANQRADVATQIAEILLRAGAEANVAQHGGWTPLHQAAAHGHLPLVRLLLTYGANPTASSEDGKTPRDLAVEKGYRAVVDLLPENTQPEAVQQQPDFP